jgi:ferredoxin
MVERKMEEQEFELLEKWLTVLNRRLDREQRQRMQDAFRACPNQLAEAETPRTNNPLPCE